MAGGEGQSPRSSSRSHPPSLEEATHETEAPIKRKRGRPPAKTKTKSGLIRQHLAAAHGIYHQEESRKRCRGSRKDEGGRGMQEEGEGKASDSQKRGRSTVGAAKESRGDDEDQREKEEEKEEASQKAKEEEEDDGHGDEGSSKASKGRPLKKGRYHVKGFGRFHRRPSRPSSATLPPLPILPDLPVRHIRPLPYDLRHTKGAFNAFLQEIKIKWVDQLDESFGYNKLSEIEVARVALWEWNKLKPKYKNKYYQQAVRRTGPLRQSTGKSRYISRLLKDEKAWYQVYPRSTGQKVRRVAAGAAASKGGDDAGEEGEREDEEEGQEEKTTKRRNRVIVEDDVIQGDFQELMPGLPVGLAPPKTLFNFLVHSEQCSSTLAKQMLNDMKEEGLEGLKEKMKHAQETYNAQLEAFCRRKTPPIPKHKPKRREKGDEEVVQQKEKKKKRGPPAAVVAAATASELLAKPPSLSPIRRASRSDTISVTRRKQVYLDPSDSSSTTTAKRAPVGARGNSNITTNARGQQNRMMGGQGPSSYGGSSNTITTTTTNERGQQGGVIGEQGQSSDYQHHHQQQQQQEVVLPRRRGRPRKQQQQPLQGQPGQQGGGYHYYQHQQQQQGIVLPRRRGRPRKISASQHQHQQQGQQQQQQQGGGGYYYQEEEEREEGRGLPQLLPPKPLEEAPSEIVAI